jgi:hypothetical protein
MEDRLRLELEAIQQRIEKHRQRIRETNELVEEAVRDAEMRRISSPPS